MAKVTFSWRVPKNCSLRFRFRYLSNSLISPGATHPLASTNFKRSVEISTLRRFGNNWCLQKRQEFEPYTIIFVCNLHTQKKYEPDCQFRPETQVLNEYSHSQWEINNLPVGVMCSLRHQSETQSCLDNALSLS